MSAVDEALRRNPVAPGERLGWPPATDDVADALPQIFDVASETRKWAQVIRAAGITVE